MTRCLVIGGSATGLSVTDANRTAVGDENPGLCVEDRRGPQRLGMAKVTRELLELFDFPLRL
jgi:hypothetical protein